MKKGSNKLSVLASKFADTLFGIRIESDGLYQDDEMSREFMESIIDNPVHILSMKARISRVILHDMKIAPDVFQKDENGEFKYDPQMEEDYGGVIEDYCRKEFYKNKIKKLELCSGCGSDNVQLRAWVRPNKGNEFVDYITDCDDDEGFCDDCDAPHAIYTAEVKFLARIIGFQVVGVDDGLYEGDIHPDMVASFCIYNLSQAREMLKYKDGETDPEWRLLAIWTGDVEEPTMMFEGDPRS